MIKINRTHNKHLIRLSGSLGLLILLSLISLPELRAADADGSATIRLSGLRAEGVSARVSIREIESVGVAEVESFNPYEQRLERYTGIWMEDFVEHFGTPGVKSIHVHAIDDYAIDFTPQDWGNMRILMVTRTNGKHIDFAAKGPMRIVYADFNPDVEKFQLSLPKWVWMITKIEFS